MRFFKDFVSAVDENGGKQVIDNMCNVGNNNFLLINILPYSETTNMRFSYVCTRSW
jgi:hypothetical protein